MCTHAKFMPYVHNGVVVQCTHVLYIPIRSKISPKVGTVHVVVGSDSTRESERDGERPTNSAVNSNPSSSSSTRISCRSILCFSWFDSTPCTCSDSASTASNCALIDLGSSRARSNRLV